MVTVRERMISKKPSCIDFMHDGMIVRFAYHNPIHYFFDLYQLYLFIVSFEKAALDKGRVMRPQDKRFLSEKFHFVVRAGNRVDLVLATPVWGHNRLSLPKNELFKAIKDMFEQ